MHEAQLGDLRPLVRVVRHRGPLYPKRKRSDGAGSQQYLGTAHEETLESLVRVQRLRLCSL